VSGELLFVYGSLRSGAGGPMHDTLPAAARSLGRARILGRIFVVDWYPGLVLGGDAWVHGELWALHDAAILVPLDVYEGYDEFTRTRTLVHLDGGDAHEAWVYAYARCTDDLPLVASGDWLAR
jgi:gamma-glutamylcyclotransferase (GGCT)/AIG2-like uncharacterized protein YtfP